MDIRQLEAFVYTVKYQSFSLAAQKLYLSQPTVSSHMQMNRRNIRQVDESTLTTLCAVCRGAFQSAKSVQLRRANPRQVNKDVCTYCQTRYGFDYYVLPVVRSPKMTGRREYRETEPS